MKRILSTSLLIAAVVVAFTGCLKDKGFDNHAYGINDPDTQPPGVGFPYGSNAKNDWGLDIGPGAQIVTNRLYVNLESGLPASSDVKVTLVDNTTALLNAYNTANGLSGSSAILPMPTAKYSFPSSLTIPAGGRNVQDVITLNNIVLGAPPGGLDANRQYAVGIKISAVDGGYKVAANLENLFMVFGIKNQYDGRYNMKGQNYHPSLNATFTGFTTTVEMHTTGPNSVKIYVPAFGGYYGPAWLGGVLNAFSSQEPEITVNPGTNAIVVTNSFPGGLTYGMGIGFNNAGYNSRWDPATKTMFFNYGYNLGAGGAFILGTTRAWIDTCIRTGPR